MNAKWYNFETLFKNLKDALKDYLHEINAPYEISATGFFTGWHFEILATPEQAAAINNWLDENTIINR